MSSLALAPFERRYFVSLPRPDRLYNQLRRQLRQPRPRSEGVQTILDEYGLTLGRMDAGPIDPGRRASVVVETSGGKKVLKDYGVDVEPAAVVHEHSILNYLGQIGFPTPRLTRTSEAGTFVARHGRVFALFDYLDGYFQYHNCLFLPPRTREFLIAAGQALGYLHRALRDFVPVGRHANGFESREGGRCRALGWFTDELVMLQQEVIRDESEQARAMRHKLLARADWLAETLSGLDGMLGRASPPRLIIHGDYGPYNLLFKPGEPVVIIDFEMARLDWRLADLASALGHFANNRVGFDFGKMRSFLTAYNSEFSLEQGELELLPAVWQYMTLRQLVSRCHRYRVYRDLRWLAQARQKLAFVDWLRANESTLREISIV